MKIILPILFIILLFSYFLRDNNPYKLIMIFGKKGCGKTTFIAKYSIKYLKKGYRVYSNVPIPGTELYNPSDIGLNTFPPESIVFCDEVGLIWNNRDYKNFQKCLIEWFKYQRQYKIKMYLFSQAFDSDKVIRNLTDTIYIARRFGSISFLRKVNKNIGISKDVEGNGQLVDCYQYGSIFDSIITFLPRYYGVFQSFDPPQLDVINSTLQDYNEYSQIAFDTKKWILYQIKLKFSNIYKKIKSIK